MRRPLRVRDAAIVAGAAAVAVALPALANGFTYDDVWLVQNHPVVRAPGGIRALLTSTAWPPTDGHGALWRPVTLTAFAAQWAAGGGAPLLFHAVTIVLSAAAAALAAAVSGALFGPVVALVAGVLFAVHPVHVEVTATVVGQAELLAAIAYLGALWAAWRGSAPQAGAWWPAAAAGALLVGLGAKEHAITLPAVLIPLWWWRSARDGRPFVEVARSQLPLLVATVVAAVAYLLARQAILGDVTHAGAVAIGLDPASPLRRAVVMLPLSLRWLELLSVPIRLSADYAPQHVIPRGVFGAWHAAALGAWLLIGVAAWSVRRTIPAAAFGAAFFGLTIAIVSNVPVPLEVLLAERLLFLPSLGWALAMAGLVARAAAAGPAPRRLAVGVVAVVAVLFAARSLLRAPVWRSNAALFAQMEREAPRSFQTHWALGALAFARGDSALGEREWREAIRLNPEHPQPIEDLGRLYARTGRWDAAVPLLERVIELDAARVGSALALGTGYTRLGRLDDALAFLEGMERRHDAEPMFPALRADVLRRREDYAAALVAARAALARDSSQWQLWLLAAETAVLAERCDAADSLADGARRAGGQAAAEAVGRVLEGAAIRKGSCK
jgi:protein O-mannosyl-transferase